MKFHDVQRYGQILPGVYNVLQLTLHKLMILNSLARRFFGTSLCYEWESNP